MKVSVWRVLLAAAVFAAVLVPVASAKSSPRVRLSLLVLPKSSFGSAAHGFTVAYGSGVVPDGAVQPKLKKLGRLTGYALGYGDEASGGYGDEESGASGLNFAGTYVERYKTAADAKKGLAFWQKGDASLSGLNQGGFSVTNVLVKVPAVGVKRFAYLTSYSASNIAPVSTLDEQVADGPYVLDVTVTAGSASTATALGSKLTKALDARLRLALKGRLHGKPAKLPAKKKAGPPQGGPDLSALALQPFNGGDSVVGKGYVVDLGAISDYNVLMQPGDGLSFLSQDAEWYPTANQASFEADYANASALDNPEAAPLDLSSVGDGVQASISDDPSLSTGVIVFSSGQLAEFIFIAEQNSPIGSFEPTQIAQAAANLINSAGLGS